VWALLEAATEAAFDEYKLKRSLHVAYVKTNLFNAMPASFQTLDSNRPWLCYWMVHSLALMGGRLGEAETDRVVDFLLRCQSRTGGFGGGPGQLSHLATTYAAVNALVTLGSERGLRGIDRDNLYTWMLSVKEPTGEFHMHVDGEIDMRGCYCAMSVAKICNILTDELASNTAKWIASCQTYEGGISSLPGLEAHGGYTFCGLAALHILGQVPLLNLPRLTVPCIFPFRSVHQQAKCLLSSTGLHDAKWQSRAASRAEPTSSWTAATLFGWAASSRSSLLGTTTVHRTCIILY